MRSYEVEGFTVERYEVPGYRCLRKNGTEPQKLPAAAVTPGEPAVFDVLYPHEQLTTESPLVFMPHGNSFEFIENVFVDAVKDLGIEGDLTQYYDLFGGTPEQTTRAGAEFMIDSTVNAPITLTMLRAGAPVVIPGNCWGDGGHGTGQVREGFIKGERLGGGFDTATLGWAKDTLTHSPAREVAVVCSGGGRRAIEMIQREWHAFDAAVLDSPADDVTAFLEAPRNELIQLSGIALDDGELTKIFESFWTGIYGTKAEALKSSLADDVERGHLSPAIYLAYSTNDPVVTAPITRRLVEAMTKKASERLVVQTFEQKVHCQLNSAESIAPALTWLNERVGGFHVESR